MESGGPRWLLEMEIMVIIITGNDKVNEGFPDQIQDAHLNSNFR